MELREFIKKNYLWLIFIVVSAIWLRVNIDFNSPSPLENAHILKGKLLLNYENFDFNFDKFSSPIPAYITGIGANAGGYIGARIATLIVSFLFLFLFYKFCYVLFEEKTAALLSVILLSLQAPIIFISKYASSDIISLTFLTAFLWLFAQMLKRKDNDKKINIILSATFFALAVASNYLLLLFVIPTIIMLIIYNKKVIPLFSITLCLIISIVYFSYSELINQQIHEIFFVHPENIKITKLLIRIAEYIAIPIMLLVAAQQMIWKTHYKSSTITLFLILSLIIPLYIILFRDMYNIYRLIPFSLIFLAPIGGILLSQFLKMTLNYKYAAIFSLFFIAVLSFWHTSKLENAFPNTDKVVEFLQKNTNSKSVIYSEDPFLPAANLYSMIKIKNFLPLYYNRQFAENKKLIQKEILVQIENYEVEFIVLNHQMNPDFNELLRSKQIFDAYNITLQEKIQFNSLMYPVNESTMEIYKLKFNYKIKNQYLAKKIN